AGQRHGPLDDFRDQRLAEGDRVALQDPAAAQAARVFLARPDTRQRAFHRRAVAALPAHDAANGAVHFDDALRRIAGALMQLVDVLRDEAVQPALAFELDQSLVAGIRTGRPGRVAKPRLPCGLAHLGVGQVVLDRRLLLGRRVPRPDALRTA